MLPNHVPILRISLRLLISPRQPSIAKTDTTPDVSAEDIENIHSLSTEDILTRIRLFDNDIKVMRSKTMRLQHEQTVMKEKIRDNGEKLKQNKALPYLVGNVVAILDVGPEAEEDGANQELDSMRKGKCAVVKTSTRQTVFLPMIGLVPPEKLKPGDLVGMNKDSYLVLDTLPAEFHFRVKAMEVNERPTETYTDLGGLEKQIEELIEAIVSPTREADKFKTLGIKPKAPAIIFINELDAIGTKRFDPDKSRNREVQRTMLELLNQLDGFSSDERIKVIAATNGIDILDPALLRSGRLDETSRARILEIHPRKMMLSEDVNFEELAWIPDEFNTAQLKATFVEAGMMALREGVSKLTHEHFLTGISEVQSKKKNDLMYFA
ncbi:P-loop containing nucleoside triphosphate hydrolase protein [Lentinula raphanica]|uniref:P-loop containing nucleoside triphosphate hydrolase protein n=1 Tax=Lentinula raphanica TaxID=153919 RepID=A0AA38UCU9_9AGAR|nr:P-loop containing nucleoside triphosphate hydrolase protein [Lentinula raphanica]